MRKVWGSRPAMDCSMPACHALVVLSHLLHDFFGNSPLSAQCVGRGWRWPLHLVVESRMLLNLSVNRIISHLRRPESVVFSPFEIGPSIPR